ncbi:MAG TPA: beta-N-acetylhexosaminidase [Magnetospirillaceae bacterium]
MPVNSTPAAVIFGCAGTVLSDAEKAFYERTNPLGFILFQRNCESPEQIKALVASMRATVGRHAPVLIDQEGGRVQRLKPPHWNSRPAMARYGRIAATDPDLARRAVALHARLIAADLLALGIDVDCTPVLDVPIQGVTDAIGDRAFSGDPKLVASLGGAVRDAFLANGVMPVIKHLPGHGRALVDSHGTVPIVRASREELASIDCVPFKALADSPWGMTCHCIYTAVDPENPATRSHKVIEVLIRGEIGFDGVLVTDDLSMGALTGTYDDRARASLAAGCDLALHCNGKMEEMTGVALGVGPVSDRTAERLAKAESRRQAKPEPVPTGGDATLAAWLNAAAE